MDNMKNIYSFVTSPQSLSKEKHDEMFDLMNIYFKGLNREIFEHDLNEKQWVICIAEKNTDRIYGFSTLILMETMLNNRKIYAFFSGDTIIHRKYWGSFLLEKEWLRLVFTKQMSEPSADWYWFLICKGYRTYRYLPVYFKKYYPALGEQITFSEKTLLDHLGYLRFKNRYDEERGIIKSDGDYRLKAGVGDITGELLNDKRIAFFQDKNPGWRNGDELACLVRLEKSNLRRRLEIE